MSDMLLGTCDRCGRRKHGTKTDGEFVFLAALDAVRQADLRDEIDLDRPTWLIILAALGLRDGSDESHKHVEPSAAQKRVAELEAALRELVALKDKKDILTAKDFEEYSRRKPAAWATARALLANTEEEKP